MATKRQRELYELLVHWGIPLHIAADVASKGRLNTAEIKVLTKVLKHVIPITGRVVAGEIVGAATTIGLAGRAALSSPRTLLAGAARNPYTLAAALLYLGYIKREEIAEVGAAIAEDPRTEAAYEQLIATGRGVQQTLQPVVAPLGLPGIRPVSRISVKRKVSKANRAVKQGMTWLKAGGKAVTGAVAGTLPGGAFRTAVKAAGMANPKTKSKPGKGKSIMNKLARRLKKWW
jgi:hypothetical protein